MRQGSKFVQGPDSDSGSDHRVLGVLQLCETGKGGAGGPFSAAQVAAATQLCAHIASGLHMSRWKQLPTQTDSERASKTLGAVRVLAVLQGKVDQRRREALRRLAIATVKQRQQQAQQTQLSATRQEEQHFSKYFNAEDDGVKLPHQLGAREMALLYVKQHTPHIHIHTHTQHT